MATIIGITGTIGAGKGAAVAYLVNQKGFAHYSARTLLTEYMEARGIGMTRDTMAACANELRSTYGPQYVFSELWKRAAASEKPSVIESIRTLGEADALKRQGGMLLSIDADRAVRYGRIHGRGSVLDNVTFEEFVAQEEREMHSEDPTKQNLAGVMARADFSILNNGTLIELHRHIDDFLLQVNQG